MSSIIVKVRMSGGTYVARAGNSYEAKTASCTSSPTEAVIKAAQKYFSSENVVVDRKSDGEYTAKIAATESRLDIALAACRSIRFAVKNAERFKGEFSLNDLLAADHLARKAIEMS